MHVYVAEPVEGLLCACVRRVEPTEVVLELLVRALGEVHLPDALIVGEKGVDRGDSLHPRFERRARERESAALRAAGRADARRLYLVKVHDDPRESDRVEEYLTEEQLVLVIVEPPDDVTVQRIAEYAAGVFALPALAAAVERRRDVSGARPAEVAGPVARVHRVPVEMDDPGGR